MGLLFSFHIFLKMHVGKLLLFLGGLSFVQLAEASHQGGDSGVLGHSCSTEGWTCNGEFSRYCDCSSRRRSLQYTSYNRASSQGSSQQSQCSRYGRFVVDEKCSSGCSSGKCLGESEVCGTSWAVNGVATLDYNSATCPLNDRILKSNWKSWKNIQASPNVTRDYLIGVDSDIDWFNRNMEWMFVTPNGSFSSAVFNESKPLELEQIQSQCQEVYEKFTCMRNLPECSMSGDNVEGQRETSSCVQACEAVSSSCFAEFELTCRDLNQNYTAQGLNESDFTCSSLRELECWDTYCTKFPLGEGQNGLGWHRECEYMCDEFQQGKSGITKTEEVTVFGIILAILFPLLVIGGIIACCFCCRGCPGKNCLDNRNARNNDQTNAIYQAQTQPVVQMASPYQQPAQYNGGYPQQNTQYQQAPPQYQYTPPPYGIPLTQHQQAAPQYHQAPPSYGMPFTQNHQATPQNLPYQM